MKLYVWAIFKISTSSEETTKYSDTDSHIVGFDLHVEFISNKKNIE